MSNLTIFYEATLQNQLYKLWFYFTKEVVMLLSVSDFATAVGLTRQAIYDAINTGLFTKTGKKIDTESTLVQLYIKSDGLRRKIFFAYSGKKDEAPEVEKKIPVEKKPPEKTEKQQSQQKPVVHKAVSEEPDFGEVSNIATEDVIKKTQFAKLLREQENVISKKFENQKARDEWCDRKTVMAVIPSFISKIHSGMKMVSETSLSDLGIKHGIVFSNEDYVMFQNAVIETTNMAIEQVQLDIKNEKM